MIGIVIVIVLDFLKIMVIFGFILNFLDFFVNYF